MGLDVSWVIVWGMTFVFIAAAIWLLRNRMPQTREAILQAEIERLRDDHEKLRTTVNVMLRERGEDQRTIERLRARVADLERALAAATGRTEHGEAAPVKLLTALRKTLLDKLSEEEVRTLAFDLDVDYAGLPGEGRLAKIREMLEHLNDRCQVDRLVTRLRQMRPDVEIMP